MWSLALVYRSKSLKADFTWLILVAETEQALHALTDRGKRRNRLQLLEGVARATPLMLSRWFPASAQCNKRIFRLNPAFDINQIVLESVITA